MTGSINEVTLTPRLLTAASMARQGVTAADIGTDHAYIPAYLVANGLCAHAVACDINPGPLGNARATLKKYGMEQSIELRLGNGLEPVKPNEAQDIYICGMGGDIISEIILAAPWVKNNNVHLILQPMTRAEHLRAFLFANGYSILRERAVTEGRHCYTVINAAYTGEKSEPDEVTIHIGRLTENLDEDAKRYILKQSQRLKKKALGMMKARNASDEAEKILVLSEKLQKAAQ